jgi:hypothetical protein
MTLPPWMTPATLGAGAHAMAGGAESGVGGAEQGGDVKPLRSGVIQPMEGP